MAQDRSVPKLSDTFSSGMSLFFKFVKKKILTMHISLTQGTWHLCYDCFNTFQCLVHCSDTGQTKT